MEATVSALLNQQINKEFYSAYLYLDIANFYARILTMAPCGPDWTRNSPPSAPRIQRCMYSSAWEKTARLCR